MCKITSVTCVSVTSYICLLSQFRLRLSFRKLAPIVRAKTKSMKLNANKKVGSLMAALK